METSIGNHRCKEKAGKGNRNSDNESRKKKKSERLALERNFRKIRGGGGDREEKDSTRRRKARCDLCPLLIP